MVLKRKIVIIIELMICFVFLSSFDVYSHNKNNVLIVKIEGKKYKQLSLRIGVDNGTPLSVDGQSENKQDWTFFYPDSVYEKQKYAFLYIKDHDSIDHRLLFRIISNTDTLRVGDISFRRDKSILNIKYLKTTVGQKSFETYFKTPIRDVFLVKKDIDPQFMALANCMSSGYSMFAYDTLAYNEKLERYIALTRKFPNSIYAINILASTMAQYHAKSDVQKIFSFFDNEVQHSYYGRKIDTYIKEITFRNSHLPSWEKGISEPIVRDTTMYTLVVFSASWCVPCRAEIPLLKTIYKNTQNKLDMVYVSIDEKVTVSNWNKLMNEESIPWRSLMAVGDVKRIREKYYIQSIPYTILVHPSGYKEVIDVREKDNLDKLYKVLGI